LRPAVRVLGVPGLLAAGFLTVMILVAAAAPWLAPYDPNLPRPLEAYAPPSATHLLGSDALGRDLLSRLMYGARVALTASASIIVLSTVVGTAVALVSAWVGGLVDAFVSRVLDILFAVPGIVFALAAVSVMGPGPKGVVAGLALGYTPYVARVVRGAALREVRMDYISAAWVQGRSGTAVCLRHLLPNLRSLIIAQAVSSLGFALIDLSALSFLGLGVQPPGSDWGLTMRAGLDSALRGHAGEALSAGLCIALLVASVIVLGDRLSQRAEERA
jgi:peptide/nickel transport system permease protein